MFTKLVPLLISGALAAGCYGTTSVAYSPGYSYGTPDLAYVGPGGVELVVGNFRGTLRVRDGGTRFAINSTDNYPLGSTIAGTWKTNGPSIETSYTCKSGGRPPDAYTATPTSLDFLTTSNGVTVVATYTRLQ